MTKLKNNYFNIHTHTMYSSAALGFADATTRPKELIDKAIELGMTGVMITEHEFIGSHPYFMTYRDELKEKGKYPENFTIAFGNEIYLTEDREKNQQYYHFILGAYDKKGYEGLRRLSSIAWENSYFDRGLRRRPTLKSELEEIMKEYKGHIFSSEACLGHYIDQELLRFRQDNDPIHKQNVMDFLKWQVKVFGKDNVFLEIQPADTEDQHYVNKWYKELAQKTKLPLIFSTDVHYLDLSAKEAHKIFLNSKSGDREVDSFYSSTYIQTGEEIVKHFNGDFTEEEILKMYDNLEMLRQRFEDYDIFMEQQVPVRNDVVIPEIDITIKQKKLASQYPYVMNMIKSDYKHNKYWGIKCLNELNKRGIFDKAHLEYLNNEADVILYQSEHLQQPVVDYFITMEKIIDLMWNEADTLVGPGRGSAVSWVSNYLLDITDLDPVDYDIPYWRSTF